MKGEGEVSELERQGRYDPVPPITVSRRLPRSVQAAVDEEAAHGLVAVTRIRTAAWVAEEAMLRTQILEGLEQHLAAEDPVAADRYARYVEDFVLVARTTLRRLATRS